MCMSVNDIGEPNAQFLNEIPDLREVLSVRVDDCRLFCVLVGDNVLQRARAVDRSNLIQHHVDFPQLMR